MSRFNEPTMGTPAPNEYYFCEQCSAKFHFEDLCSCDNHTLCEGCCDLNKKEGTDLDAEEKHTMDVDQ